MNGIEIEKKSPAAADRAEDRPETSPAVDIYDRGQELALYADMPGVNENDLEITLEKNVLTIYGRSQAAAAPEGYRARYGEYRIVDYRRAFTLSNEIDQEGIQANLKNGVLTLTLPKKPAQVRKIEVSAR